MIYNRSNIGNANYTLIAFAIILVLSILFINYPIASAQRPSQSGLNNPITFAQGPRQSQA